jgi:hypothetical protein
MHSRSQEVQWSKLMEVESSSSSLSNNLLLNLNERQPPLLPDSSGQAGQGQCVSNEVVSCVLVDESLLNNNNNNILATGGGSSASSGDIYSIVQDYHQAKKVTVVGERRHQQKVAIATTVVTNSLPQYGELSTLPLSSNASSSSSSVGYKHKRPNILSRRSTSSTTGIAPTPDVACQPSYKVRALSGNDGKVIQLVPVVGGSTTVDLVGSSINDCQNTEPGTLLSSRDHQQIQIMSADRVLVLNKGGGGGGMVGGSGGVVGGQHYSVGNHHNSGSSRVVLVDNSNTLNQHGHQFLGVAAASSGVIPLVTATNGPNGPFRLVRMQTVSVNDGGQQQGTTAGVIQPHQLQVQVKVPDSVASMSKWI